VKASTQQATSIRGSAKNARFPYDEKIPVVKRPPRFQFNTFFVMLSFSKRGIILNQTPPDKTHSRGYARHYNAFSTGLSSESIDILWINARKKCG
jgi:hypothetical protein